MFKVGKTYTITMWEGGENGGGEGTFGGCKVVEADGTCIKYVNPYDNKGREIILNTASLAFVRAELQD